MGSFFSAPSAPPPPPPAPVGPDPQKVAEQQRLDDLARQRRGLGGTIATSDRGMLDPSVGVPQAKSLLGE